MCFIVVIIVVIIIIILLLYLFFSQYYYCTSYRLTEDLDSYSVMSQPTVLSSAFSLELAMQCLVS